MGLQVEHEIHHRRWGRNLGVGLLLVGFVILVMALTVVKVTRGMAPHAMDAPGGLGSTQPITADPDVKVTP
jgi:hypothetical protein